MAKIPSMRVAELRKELEKRGLDAKGLKPALVAKLEAAAEGGGGDGGGGGDNVV